MDNHFLLKDNWTKESIITYKLTNTDYQANNDSVTLDENIAHQRIEEGHGVRLKNGCQDVLRTRLECQISPSTEHNHLTSLVPNNYPLLSG
jgi:hypothetical protein